MIVSQSDIANSLILWQEPAIAAPGPPEAAAAPPAGAARAGPRGVGTRRVLRFCPRRRAGSRQEIRTRGGQAGGRRNFTPGGFTVSLII
jgi:hypothetical protein